MPVRPVLMVLYTNDAVEVRYTDGSRLHVLPCGSSFTYHSHQDAHPVHGMKSVQQRCQYVTSMYRGMVLPALDFRNRFAERPYVCKELQEESQVIDLYAKIAEVGWPKQVTNQNCEVLEDGSVRITSEDEFGSLVLSPHRKDFTVCYLSSLSCEKKRDRRDRNKCKQIEKQVKDRRIHREKLKHSKEFTGPMQTKSSSSREGTRTPENVESCQYDVFRKQDEKMKDDLNISPITQASCADSPRALSNASGSPISTLDAVKDSHTNFRPFSTPTQELDGEEPICTPYGSTAVFHKYKTNERHKHERNLNGSYLEEQRKDDIRNSKENLVHMWQENQTGLNKEDLVSTLTRSHNADLTLSSQGSGSSDRSHDRSHDPGKEDLETRCSYCWVTRHISCDECPVTWSHVLKLAQAVAEDRSKIQDTGQGKQTDTKKGVDSSVLRKIRRDQCIFSTLPRPLPVSCPGQHLHKTQAKKVFTDNKDPVEDPSTFNQGRLKVLLIDGIIYRILRLVTMNVVEVYPGDGSVLVSQGMSAHFFQHIIPNGDKIEERTYSLKSPPQLECGTFSVKNLISRANRFLTYVRQEDQNMSASTGLCCWKHEEMTIVEPLSTTILEESVIPGYGKFTAMSNGQVRVVFQDRTCLDMTWDFSKRIRTCLDHSNNSNIQVPVPDKKAGTCRLLLPNGQYQMVDIKQPGVYKKYTDVTNEWADWVNSSPIQRETFYRTRNDKNMNLSVERELQRIQCFNYVLDNAVLKKTASGPDGTDQYHTGAFRPYNKQETKPGPSILRNSNVNKPIDGHDPDNNVPIRSVQIYSPPRSLTASSTNQMSHNSSSLSGHGSISSVIGQSWKPSTYMRQTFPESQVSSHMKGQGLEGFDAVRQALLRTSSIIKDIDHMLDKR